MTETASKTASRTATEPETRTPARAGSRTTARATPAISADKAQRGFSRSILVSGIRCVLTYVVLPFVTPLIGLAPGVGPVVGLVVGTIAIAANVLSIRRFWRADHRWKKPVTVLHLGVIVLLGILFYLDVTELVT